MYFCKYPPWACIGLPFPGPQLRSVLWSTYNVSKLNYAVLDMTHTAESHVIIILRLKHRKAIILCMQNCQRNFYLMAIWPNGNSSFLHGGKAGEIFFVPKTANNFTSLVFLRCVFFGLNLQEKHESRVPKGTLRGKKEKRDAKALGED